MKTTAAWLISTLLACSAHAADWTYNVKYDSFDNTTIQTASLTGESGARIVVETRSDGTKLAFFSGRQFECFPNCTVQVKFDADPPVRMQAHGPRIISHILAIQDFGGFTERLKTARTVTLRAQFVHRTDDLSVTTESTYNPEKFEVAKARSAADAECKKNAVSENYADCMTRLAPKQ